MTYTHCEETPPFHAMAGKM